MLPGLSADETAVEMLEQARRHFRADRHQECLAALGQAGDDALDSSEFWLLRAESLRYLGKLKDAIKAAKIGLELAPQHIGLIDSLGLSLLSSKKAAAADAQFLAALALAPEHPDLLAHHAAALYELGRMGEAEEVYTKLLAIDPDSPAVLEMRARLAVRFRDPNAERYVTELLADDPDNEAAHSLRGVLSLRRKQAGNAAEAFQEAAALNPGNVALAKAARSTRVVAHPLMAPSRWILMLGSGRARVVYIAVTLALRGLHLAALAVAWLFFWVVFVLVVPRALRLHYKRRYGSL